MKMILSLCLLALTACGSVDAQPVQEVRTAEVNQSDTVEILPVLGYGADVNRGPCATGYTRTAPGLCTKDSPTTYPTSSACNSRNANSFDSIPLTAKTVILGFQIEVRSQNGIALRSTDLSTYLSSDTTCAGSVVTFNRLSVYEFVATAATRIGFISGTLGHVPIVNAIINTKSTGTDTVNIIIQGYTD